MQSSKTNEQDYKTIAKCDGDYCKLCGSTSTEKKLVVVGTYATSNKKILLCKDCLIQKRLYELCVSERVKIKEDVGFVTELQVNRQKEMRFRMHVYEKLLEVKNAKWDERDMINSTSEVIGISPITGRRYLDKMCSSTGVLTRIDNGEDTFVEFSMKRTDFQ